MRELIAEFVQMNVQQLNEKETEIPLLHYLTKGDMELQSLAGKVGFQTKYNENKIDAQKAIEVAIQAFLDGLYKVFENDQTAEYVWEDVWAEGEPKYHGARFGMLWLG